MTTYYIDPTWGGTKSGTFAAPYSLYTSVTAPAPGDFILQKAGTTFSGHTAAVSTKSGTAGNPITYGVYDATTGAQITTTVGAATMAGTGSATHVFSTGGESFIEIVGFKIQTITAASAGIRLGSNSTGNTDGNAAKYCTITNETCFAGILVYTNLGVVGHTVDHCTLTGLSQYGLYFDGSLLGTKATITNNNCSSNGRSGIRSALSTLVSMSGTMANNTCNSNGLVTATIPYGNGIDIVSNSADMLYYGNTCSSNYLTGMVLGSFTGATGSNQIQVHNNDCHLNGEFGICVSTGGSWLVIGNRCNYNGANRGNKYGRGIEIVGSSSKPVGPGIICFNTTNYNYNYGAVSNNGTEGVGIGLDDYHKDVLVFGNHVEANEGNGIQYNPNGAAGMSQVLANILIDNFAAPTSRAGTWSGYVKAQICSYTTENNARIFNNTIILTSALAAPACLYGISENDIAAGTSNVVSNNIIKGPHSVAIKFRTGVTRVNNGFFGCAKNVESNVGTTTLSDGTGAVTTDPTLDSSYRPQTAAYKRAGTNFGGTDFNGKLFYNPPNIGAVDDITATPRWSLLP